MRGRWLFNFGQIFRNIDFFYIGCFFDAGNHRDLFQQDCQHKFCGQA